MFGLRKEKKMIDFIFDFERKRVWVLGGWLTK